MVRNGWKKMYIKRILIRPLKRRLIQEFATAKGTHKGLDNLLVCAELFDGTIGLGEAAIATHITGETIELTRKNLERSASWIMGRDVSDYAAISKRLHDELPHNKAAIAAIEMAIIDALTKTKHIPLWRLFGARPKKLTTDITIVISGQDETKEKARSFYARGFRTFKIKVGRDFDADIKRVVAVKKIVKRSRILIDANQGYSASDTLRFLKCLEDAGVRPDLIEQPVPKGDWDGLKRVTRLSKVLVCADESVRSLSDCRRAIREKAVDAVNVKLMKSGLVEAREIALLAHKAGLKLMIGGMLETSLAMTAAAHLAAGLKVFDYVDLDTPFFIAGDLRRNPYLNARGVYDLGRVKEGIGITI